MKTLVIVLTALALGFTGAIDFASAQQIAQDAPKDATPVAAPSAPSGDATSPTPLNIVGEYGGKWHQTHDCNGQFELVVTEVSPNGNVAGKMRFTGQCFNGRWFEFTEGRLDGAVLTATTPGSRQPVRLEFTNGAPVRVSGSVKTLRRPFILEGTKG